MRGKKTRGKQKINIKKVEKDEDRMVTFSKRRSGIYTKLSEISILCGAEVGFLVYSGAGKPYTFGSPSFEAVAERFLNGDHPVMINGQGRSSSSSIVEAHKKMKLDELCKKYNSVMEESNAEEERRKTAAAAMAAHSLPVESDAWWKVDDPKEDEDAKQLLRTYESLYDKLCDLAGGRSHGGDASTSLAGNYRY
uniref:Agamous-like MADS-box protein AGL61 n=1 Tax=Noccaea caerulescens TaxID=107243 RepID=A0A1J3J072_NOCCA